MFWTPRACPAVARFLGPLIANKLTYRTPTPQDARNAVTRCLKQELCQVPTASCNHKCKILRKHNAPALNQVECELACLGKQQGSLLQWGNEAVALLRMGPPKRILGCNISAFATKAPTSS